jgi:hypothetical protein
MGRIVMCTAGLALCAMSWAGWTGIDWYAYGSAKPPLMTPPLAAVEDFVLQEWEIDSQPGDGGRIEVAPETQVALHGLVTLKPGVWMQPLGRSLGAQSLPQLAALQAKQQRKPIPMIRIEMVRRSWFRPGEVIVRQWSGSLSPHDAKREQFAGELLAPSRPGEYQIRVYVESMVRTRPRPTTIREALLKVETLKVRPANPSS